MPPAVRDSFIEFVTEEAEETERARWALRSEQIRILGEAAERAGALWEDSAVGEVVRRVRRDLPMTASLVGVGAVMGALVHAWLSGLFYTLIDTFFMFRV